MSNMLELRDLMAAPRPMYHDSSYLSPQQIAHATRNRRFIMPSPNGAFINQRASLTPFKMIAIAGGTDSSLSDLSGSKSKKLYAMALAAENERLKQEAEDRAAAEEAARKRAEAARIEEAKKRDEEQQRIQMELQRQQYEQQMQVEAQRLEMERQAVAREAAIREQERRQQLKFERMQQELKKQAEEQLIAQRDLNTQRDAARWQQQQQDELLAQSRREQALQNALLQAQRPVVAAEPAAPSSVVVSSMPAAGTSNVLPPEMPSAPAPWSEPSVFDNSGGFQPMAPQVVSENINWAPTPEWEIGGSGGFDVDHGMSDIKRLTTSVNSGLGGKILKAGLLFGGLYLAAQLLGGND